MFKEIEFGSASEQAQTLSEASRYTDATGKKTYELLQNRMAVAAEAMQKDFVRYYSPFQKQTIRDFIKDVVQVYGI